MYKIAFTKGAYKSLRRVPHNVLVRILKRLEQIAGDPYAGHPNVTRLSNRPGYRLRIGGWRVIYDVREEELIILVLKVGSRGEIYR